MMGKLLRVLAIEDSEDDALLLIRHLKKGGYDPVYERVDAAAAMKKSLIEKEWDIILCDYKMPNFSALSAIALLRETENRHSYHHCVRNYRRRNCRRVHAFRRS
jgi:CheY-like chemotaxis protein